MSQVLEWSEPDLLAAATSVAVERERCPGCGLLPEQHHLVEAGLDRCPGCEARQRAAKQITPEDMGVRAAFWTVADSRDSVWAKYTSAGAQWAAKHRRDPGVIVADPDDVNG